MTGPEEHTAMNADENTDAVTPTTEGEAQEAVAGPATVAAPSDGPAVTADGADEAAHADGDVADGDASEDRDEGDIAADYIEELLDICDLDGDIDIETRGGRAYISVESGADSDADSNLRVLSKPETVTALQELTRIAVQTETGQFSRLILDIGGSRATREAELNAMVERAVERLEEGATAAALPPMSSYERKLVHDIVAARGFVSESEGEGRDRHTVVKRG
ncbi:RNA-binding protein [Frigoribacterium salinisoli]